MPYSALPPILIFLVTLIFFSVTAEDDVKSPRLVPVSSYIRQNKFNNNKPYDDWLEYWNQRYANLEARKAKIMHRSDGYSNNPHQSNKRNTEQYTCSNSGCSTSTYPKCCGNSTSRVCCETDGICTLITDPTRYYYLGGSRKIFACCSSPTESVCEVTVTSSTTATYHCCNQTYQRCCGKYDCCQDNEVCCSHHPLYATYGALCSAPLKCCTSSNDCPAEFQPTCCNNICCPTTKSSCCINNNCTNSPACGCDTENPTHTVCSVKVDPITGDELGSVCCPPSRQCCGASCCPAGKVCCKNTSSAELESDCFDPSVCCGGVTCSGANTCCRNGVCEYGTSCLSALVDSDAVFKMYYAIGIAWVVLALLVLCCCFFLGKKYIRKWRVKKDLEEEEEPELTSQEVKQLKKLVKENEEIKKDIALEEQKAEKFEVLDNIKNIDISDIEEENGQLEVDNKALRKLQAKLQVPEVYVPPPKKKGEKPPGPISLIFFGGSFLQESQLLAPPSWTMGQVLAEFCKSYNKTNYKLEQFKFIFVMDHNTKEVDHSLTANEHGIPNPCRIRVELK